MPDQFDDNMQLQHCQSKHNAKKEIGRCVFLGILGLFCFIVFMKWSETWVAIAGVAFIIVVAYVTEHYERRNNFVFIKERCVLITGCDTGFGHLLSLHLSRLGVIVFACCLDVDGEGARSLVNENCSRLHVLQMDVTKSSQVESCVEYVTKVVQDKGGLWGLVNNAALNFLGDVELTTMNQFIMVSDINMIGTVRVTKAFLPLIRQSSGRIVNLSSVKGRLALPLNAAYTMTKFALEAFSDILRMELSKWKISVSIIEPSNFGGATGCLNWRTYLVPLLPTFLMDRWLLSDVSEFKLAQQLHFQ